VDWGTRERTPNEGSMPRIRLTTDIEAPPEVCFDLVLNVDTQLALDGRMQAVAGVRTGPLHQGDEVTWRSQHFGIPWRMTSRIMVTERPRRFVDEMQRGPFASWRHVDRK
jgi:ligand-binding SRPBCC domain-containing protein